RRRRIMAGWGWCLAATLVLFIATIGHIPVLSALTLPWYKATIRVSYAFSFFEVTYAAVALAELFARLDTRRRPRTRETPVRGRLVVVAGVCIAAVQLPAAYGLARLGYQNSSLIGP